MPPHHHQHQPLPPIPPSFTTLKSRILTSLSTPTSLYNDASPKGSLDTAIVPLIDRLNGLEGVVTTSSCAGRVSVFLEGRKGPMGEGRRGERAGDEKSTGGMESEDEVDDSKVDMRGGVKGKKSVPGGKGLGGRWLFVSHEAVEVPECSSTDGVEAKSLTNMFGLTRHLFGKPRGNGEEGVRRSRDMKNVRYVRFAFEPMILHIATASLAHAAPIPSAAISAGFRESGVQSLKNLTDPNAVPMVAVRSAGLAFESIIGVVRESSVPAMSSEGGEDKQQQQEEEVIEALVDEEYLETLVRIANERFTANTERIKRFEELLFGGLSKKNSNDWEDKETRQERKRAEGLKRREEPKANPDTQGPVNGDTEDGDVGIRAFEEAA
ncbi:MAG: hypothetical protein Q9166_004937 [cf. Caloplaca sp. 2 TL-2023]